MSTSPVISTSANVRNITINTSASVTNNNTLNVFGNWTNNGSYSSTGTNVFQGSSAQTITGATTFKNLTINNNSGVSLNSAVITNGTLLLTLGPLASTGNLTVDLTNGGAISGDGIGAISGNVTTVRNIQQAGWHLIGSPLSGQTYGDINDNIPLNVTIYNIYTYQESTTSTDLGIGWNTRTEGLTTLLTGSKDGAGSPSAMIGYGLYIPASANLDFTGGYTHSSSYSNGNLSFTNSSSASADGW